MKYRAENNNRVLSPRDVQRNKKLPADILLIYPGIGDMDVIRDRPHLPLSLIQAATLVHKDYNVVVIDTRVEKNWKAVLSNRLKEKPLLAGLSVISGQPVAEALKISKFIKSRSQVPVVWGGNHATLCPEQTLSDPSIDMVVIGDGEEVLPELVRTLAARREPAGIMGVWYKSGGRIIRNEKRRPADLNTLPLPPYHLVNTEDYVQEYGGKRMINLETSRGCIHRCRYCYHTGSGSYHNFRCLDSENTVKRIRWACENFGVDGVYLVDDNFFLDKERGMKVVKSLAASKVGIYWQIQGVDVPGMLSFSHGEMTLLQKSGLMRISVGAESGSPDVLKYMKKPHTVKMLVKANKKWSRYNINVFYNWLSGLPGETLDDVEKTVKLMFRIIRDNKNARLSPLYNFLPFPDTDLWYEVIRNYRFVPPGALDEWKNYDWKSVNVPYLPENMRETLDNLYYPSLCMDNKFDDYGLPWPLYMAIRLYQPLARWRMKNLFCRWPFEKHLAPFVEKMLLYGRL